MVTLMKDIKAEERTEEKEATIRKHIVAREKKCFLCFPCSRSLSLWIPAWRNEGKSWNQQQTTNKYQMRVKHHPWPQQSYRWSDQSIALKPCTEKANRNLGKYTASFLSHTHPCKSFGSFQRGNGGTCTLHSHLTDWGNSFKLSEGEEGREGRRKNGRAEGR